MSVVRERKCYLHRVLSGDVDVIVVDGGVSVLGRC